MNVKLIMGFLKDIANNNNRKWFLENKDEYELAKAEFEEGIAQAIGRIADFDEEIIGVTVKDSTYRFYRDTRFSPDKSPYKNHFGAYINAHGKKALRGGYYIHLEPGHCLLATGNYWLPTNILTSCRNKIMSNEEEWLRCVRSSEFLQYYDAPEISTWGSPQGFGLSKLKNCPTGFPKDYEYVSYLRLKDYCAWHSVADGFFGRNDWLDKMECIFRAAKPMMDFMNEVIDDYE